MGMQILCSRMRCVR